LASPNTYLAHSISSSINILNSACPKDIWLYPSKSRARLLTKGKQPKLSLS
jgi:hypothetical protein